MSESPLDLVKQLSQRVTAFLSVSGLTHRELAKLVGVERSHLTSFLTGKSGLSSQRTLRLLQILNSSRAELERKFGRKVTSHILELQERGERVQFDGDGWVPGQSGNDPVNSTGIDDTWKKGGEPSGDDLIDTLRTVQNLHRKAIAEIDGYIASAQKAKVNQGPTSSPKSLPSNETSSRPGVRPDAFRVNPSVLLAHLREDREKIEAELRLQRAIAEERGKRDAAKTQLMELTKK